MRARGIVWMAAAAWMVIGLIGCGDHNNILGGVADDNSIEAKIQEAQIALDKGDCEGAIKGFTEALNARPDDLGLRANLAASYMCRSGFSITELIRIAAELAGGGGAVTSQNVLNTILSDAVTSLNTDWPADTDTAILLLTGYESNPDIAFNLAMYQIIKSLLIVADILNFTNGAVDCANPQGSPLYADCQMTLQDMTELATALQQSSDLLAAPGLAPDIAYMVDVILFDLNSGSPDDPINCADFQSYLINQTVDPNGELQCI